MLGDGAVAVRWEAGAAGVLALDANLSRGATHGFAGPAGRVIWQEGSIGDDGAFAPFTVRWSIGNV